MDIFKPDIDRERYIIATYNLHCQGTLADGALSLAIGQSIGNPSIRNNWETEKLINDHACVILHDHSELGKVGMTVNSSAGVVQIGFPLANFDFDTDGISQLVCQLMGGQMDIDSILGCRLIDIEFPESVRPWNPKFGISGIRVFTDAYDRPLFGGIVKPKVGLTPNELLKMVQEMVAGGVDFIKEDEIMSNPLVCPLDERVPLIMNWLRVNAPKVIYAVSITSDPIQLLARAEDVYHFGGNAIHFNIWSGLGSYKAVREMDLPLFLFYQKSGDAVLTDPSHRYGIDWLVLCKLAVVSGVDFIHAGMWGGYMNNDETELANILKVLRDGNVLPSLSCGMRPELIRPITDRFGIDYMATAGGYIHGHADGTRAGSREMKTAITEWQVENKFMEND